MGAFAGKAGPLFALLVVFAVSVTGAAQAAGIRASSGGERTDGPTNVPRAPGAVQVASLTNHLADSFGNALAVAGDMAVAGAPNHFGQWGGACAAHVLTRTGSAWASVAAVVPADVGLEDEFGEAVAFDGQTAVVGAPLKDVGGNGNQGAAYVYRRSGGGLVLQGRLTAADGAASDVFGSSVAVSGDWLFVGAYQHWAEDGTNQGAVYVFTRSGSGWQYLQTLWGDDGQFGYSVAVDGDTAVVGAPVTGQGGRGEARVFELNGSTWRHTATLVCGDTCHAGWSVALDGDVAVLGAPEDGAGGQAGAAFVFTRAGGRWRGPAKVIAPDTEGVDDFGWSVAVSGDKVLVGAPLADRGGKVDQGAAWAFAGKRTCWDTCVLLPFSSSGYGNYFGRAVALSDSTALVGVPSDNDGTVRSDSVRVFTLSGMTPTRPAIRQVRPGAIKRGKWLSVFGSAFGDPRDIGYVKFVGKTGTKRATGYLAWRGDYICCRVPKALRKGTVRVVVVTAVGASKAKSVTVK